MDVLPQDTSRTTTAAVGSAGVPRHSAPLAAPGTSLRSPPARPPPPPARRGGGTAGQRHPASRGALCSRMGAIPRGRPRVAARSRPRTLSRKAACRGGKSPRPRPAARGDPADGPIWSPPRTRWVASNCPTRPSSEGGQICRSFSGARMRTPWAATSSPAPLVEVRPPRNSRRAGAPLPSSSETRTSIPRTSGPPTFSTASAASIARVAPPRARHEPGAGAWPRRHPPRSGPARWAMPRRR
mmetsp:Transcript_25015/g.79278  ORF Transcript_25015/g.79278 Transcript_25015/m.79278 type:complete len:241 (+) Transcript_25015:629-1351(+)